MGGRGGEGERRGGGGGEKGRKGGRGGREEGEEEEEGEERRKGRKGRSQGMRMSSGQGPACPAEDCGYYLISDRNPKEDSQQHGVCLEKLPLQRTQVQFP